MAAINPDAYQTGLQYLPMHCVTALFATSAEAFAAIGQLREADFTESQMQAYLGEQGARQLDVDGERISFFEKVLQALTQGLADDAMYLDHADAVLKRGGALVSVDTGDNESLVRRAAGVLKAAGGSDVQHWGQWRSEQF